MSIRLPAGVGRLVERLGTSEHAEALVALAAEFALDQPLEAFVDPARVLAAVDRALAPELVERWAAAHLAPALERERGRWAEREALIGDYLAAELKAELRALAARPVQVDERVLRRLVQQDSVRHMLRSVVEETLDRFVSTFKPGGSGGGLAGSLGRSAFGFAKRAGGGIIGNLAEQLEGQLRKAATGFVQGSMDLVLERTVAILASPEMQQQLGRSGLAAFDGAMRWPLKTLAAQAKALDLEALSEGLPGQIAHLLAREDVRQGILDELAALLAVEGAQPVRALLSGPDHAAAVVADLTAIAGPLVQAFSQTEGFAAWLQGASAR